MPRISQKSCFLYKNKKTKLNPNKVFSRKKHERFCETWKLNAAPQNCYFFPTFNSIEWICKQKDAYNKNDFSLNFSFLRVFFKRFTISSTSNFVATLSRHYFFRKYESWYISSLYKNRSSLPINLPSSLKILNY